MTLPFFCKIQKINKKQNEKRTRRKGKSERDWKRRRKRMINQMTCCYMKQRKIWKENQQRDLITQMKTNLILFLLFVFFLISFNKYNNNNIIINYNLNNNNNNNNNNKSISKKNV